MIPWKSNEKQTAIRGSRPTEAFSSYRAGISVARGSTSLHGPAGFLSDGDQATTKILEMNLAVPGRTRFYYTGKPCWTGTIHCTIRIKGTMDSIHNMFRGQLICLFCHGVLWTSLAGLQAEERPQAAPQAPRKSRLHGYVGGPYKVLVADFTGDRHADVMIGYRNLGIVSVAAGNGKGQFSAPVRNTFSDEDRRVYPDDANWSEPHVHNLAQADLDEDGLADIACAIGGLSQRKPGRILLARNLGQGKFQRIVEYAVPSQAKGVRFADMDRDGRLDLLYTARGSGYEHDLKVGRLYIRQGLGNWKFGPARVSPAGKSAYYVEVADLDNDQFPDVLIPNEHDRCVTYFMNPGKDLFQGKTALVSRRLTATRIPDRRSHAINDVRATDLNGDGNQDVVTANLGTSTVSIFLGNGDGSFRQDTLLEAGKNGAFLGIGDLDQDGDQDFVITHWTEDFVSVFLNQGDGTFAPRRDYQAGLGNYGVDVVDLNHDGWPDIVTANYRQRSVSVLLGKGKGMFQPAINTSRGLRGYQGKWIPAPLE